MHGYLAAWSYIVAMDAQFTVSFDSLSINSVISAVPENLFAVIQAG
jgi:hypothetical protein